MKKYIYKICALLFAINILFACEDAPSRFDGYDGGKPVVRYIRPCDATTSDSLLSSAYLGNQIAIIGDELAGVNAIYFNDQKAVLNPEYVTDKSIIVTIPNGIPSIKQDIIKLCTNKDTVLYNFETKVPAPAINSMDFEYAAEGATTIIHGLYFVNDGGSPLEVYFTNNLKAEIISSDLNNISIKIPTGAQPGPITVKSVYGSTVSTLWYKDNRNIIANFNPNNYPDYNYFFGWHGASGVSDVDGINGYYLKINGDANELTNDSWDDGFLSWEKWTYLPTDPDFFDANKISKYVCKFEVKVIGTWSCKALQIIFTGASDVMLNWQNGNGLTYNSKYGAANGYVSDSEFPRALWQPWATTEDKTFETDQWMTVSIPMSDFTYNASGAKLAAPNGGGHYSGITIFLNGGGVTGTSCNTTMYIDNLRIVEK
ncbi:conserved exported hypothetical protein [uncultured Paludibacter sp.]|uniref:Surface glycan-binding protein B xyloglucan binding domain-containing protein n=1 Tax=uncultured Paludibacter sp. TaxID=497635 RepID=A0A653A9G9_9BACT|nr:conserved exported hypothetical protein [uncultured Paludibacter sp.]